MRGIQNAVVLLAWLVPTVAQADVVINEFLPNPDGTDTGQEYVELYNDGGSPVDVSGWTVQAGTSRLAVKATIPDATVIPPGGYYLLGESLVAGADLTTGTLSLGNASSSGDALALADGDGTIQDTIIYGPNNSDGFLDDDGSVASPGPKPVSGKALGRSPDGADTNDSAVDITVQEPTPGSANPAVEVFDCDEAIAVSGLVLNEVVVDPDGADDGLEWVEIYNGSGAAVDLSGYLLEASTSSFGGAATEFPNETSVAGGGYLLVAGTSIATRDVDLIGSLPNASSNADGLQLRDCRGAVVDTVIYGATNEDGWIDDSGSAATSLAPKATGGNGFGRSPNGVDTDESGADFSVLAEEDLTPGAANPDPPPCDPGADIVINEFMADPTEADDENEWVELYNAGDTEITLAGWFLGTGTSSLTGGTVLEDQSLPPGGYFVLGKANVAEADQEFDSSLGNATSSSDGLQLRDCEGSIIDTVIYGGPNSDEFIDDTGAVATSLAPRPAAGASLARLQDGFDNDASQTDFAVDPVPTPGAANPVLEPVECEPAPGSAVVLNELLVNPDGDDAGFEWIELYNPTGAPISLDGWGIAAAGKLDQIDVVESRFGGGVDIPAEGYLVIGGADVEEADFIVPLALGNGSDGDAVVLYDCEGNRIDSVIYGATNDDLMTDDAGQTPETTYVQDPSSGASIARVEDGVDSDAGNDWFVDGSPSPGRTNFQDPTGTPQPGGGCGRNDNPDVATEPRSGCGRSDTPPAMAGLVLLFAAMLRRRRRA